MLSNSFEALNAICFNSLEPIDYHPLQKSGDSLIASFIFIFCWDHGSRVLTKQITVGSFGKKLRFVERPNQTKSSKKKLRQVCFQLQIWRRFQPRKRSNRND